MKKWRKKMAKDRMETSYSAARPTGVVGAPGLPTEEVLVDAVAKEKAAMASMEAASAKTGLLFASGDQPPRENGRVGGGSGPSPPPPPEPGYGLG